MHNTIDIHAAHDLRDAASVDSVRVRVTPALSGRNRLTCAFRPILAIPHILLVGGPIGFATTFVWNVQAPAHSGWGTGTGVLGAVAGVIALIGWFAIVFGPGLPKGLWTLSAFYLRWRVRAVAYLLLLRDEYPPFGDASYPAEVEFSYPGPDRDHLSVALRPILAIPQIVIVVLLGIGLAITTFIAWLSILVTGKFPRPLYTYAVGVLRWSTRVEAYILLLRDEYPPFALE